jgi:glycosyltransferase involved in cell wall biosynthesis
LSNPFGFSFFRLTNFSFAEDWSMTNEGLIRHPSVLNGLNTRTRSITAFFPAFNDKGSIAAIVTQALALLPQFTNDYEVIVVNDGSSDGTAAVLDELARQYERVRVIHHPHNRGYGGALRSGFAHATKDLVFYPDGDGQYSASLSALARLIAVLHAAARGAHSLRFLYAVVEAARVATACRRLFRQKQASDGCERRFNRLSIEVHRIAPKELSICKERGV